MTLVVADSYRTAQRWAHERNVSPRDWRYAARREDLKGYRGLIVLTCGWYESRWYDDIADSERMGCVVQRETCIPGSNSPCVGRR